MTNHCNCPRPPGGSVSCGPNQVAFCKVVAGEPYTGCLTPPEDAFNWYDPDRRVAALLKWTLEEIGFDLSQGIFDSASQQFLFHGGIEFPQQIERIEAGSAVLLEGRVRQGGKLYDSTVAIRVPQEFGAPGPLPIRVFNPV